MADVVNSSRKNNPEPLFSIVLPVFDPPLRLLKRCLRSVRRQTYSNWELVIVNDASRNSRAARVLRKISLRDSRVKLRNHPVNLGISASTRTGIDSSGGEFIVLLDHDDELLPHALMTLSNSITHDPDADFIYSDEMLSDDDGNITTLFKPDFSYVRLLSQNYIGHLVAIRRRVIDECGGVRDGFDGAQDYDICLRAAVRSRKIIHIREVLYRWNIHRSSYSQASHTRSEVEDAGLRALQDHLAVHYGGVFTARHSHLAGCFEIECARNSPVDMELITLNHSLVGWASAEEHEESSVEFESMINDVRDIDQQIRASTKSVVVIVVGRFRGMSTESLQELEKYLSVRGVGVVAPAVVNTDGVLVSSGNFHRNGRVVRAGFGIAASDHAFLGPLEIPREVSSVGWELFAIRPDTYIEVGGLSLDVDPRVALVDLSLRLRNVGYVTVVNPHVRLIVSELYDEVLVEDLDEAFLQRWSKELSYDPFDWVPKR